MKSEKDTLVPMSEKMLNPYLCDPRDFEVIEAPAPFHGQCGDSSREYKQLLRDFEKLNSKSPFTKEGEVHPNVNRNVNRAKPHAKLSDDN